MMTHLQVGDIAVTWQALQGLVWAIRTTTSSEQVLLLLVAQHSTYRSFV